MPASNIKTGMVTVPAAATQLAACTGGGAIPKNTLITRLVNPGATNTIYLGFDSTVSATNGYPLAPGQSVPLELQDPGLKLWIIGTAADKLGWLATLA